MLKKFIRSLFPTSSLKSRIFRNLIIFTTIPFLFIAIYIYVYTNQKNVKEYSDNIRERLDRCDNIINGKLVRYIDKSSNIVLNPYLLKNIKKDYSNDLEQMMYFLDNISAMIGEPFSINVKSPYIIHAYNETLYDGKFVERLEVTGENTLVRKVIESPATEIIWDQELTEKNKQKYLTFYRNIVDYKTSVGVLEVSIPYSEVESEMDSVGIPENGLIFSTNEVGDVLHFNNQTGTEVKDISSITRDRYIIVSDTLRNGHRITAAIPKGEVYKTNLNSFLILTAGFILYLFVMLLASKVTAQKITGSLERFINKIKQNDNLLLNEEMIQIKGSDEVAIIKQKFIELMSRMNEIYKEMMNVKLEKNSLEIELLQSRLNPHLLYNSLSVIKWNALWNKDQKTAEMIDAMTKYYRTALNKGNSIINIASELEMIKEYVKINIFAHSASYILEVDVEESVTGYYTLKHLLQPVVENSILHGLNGKREDARITIKGYLEEQDIVFVVSDNGRGMDRETVERIINLDYTSGYGGYGIKNLIKRIQVYYGSSYGIKITSEIGAGTTVAVRIEALDEKELARRMQSKM